MGGEEAVMSNLVLHYNDGRIEMYRDENEYRRVMRQRAREAKYHCAGAGTERVRSTNFLMGVAGGGQPRVAHG